MTESKSIAEVVGINSRELRLEHGLTLADVSYFAGQFGLKWSPGKVGDLESGRVRPSLSTLYVLAGVFSVLLDRPVPLRRFLQTRGVVEVNAVVAVEGEEFARGFEGEPLQWDTLTHLTASQAGRRDEVEEVNALVAALPGYLKPGSWPAIWDGLSQYGETERRVAKTLGVDRVRLVAECHHLWGRTYAHERDRRAGPAANAQAKGRVSRDLKDELLQSVRANGHGEDPGDGQRKP